MSMKGIGVGWKSNVETGSGRSAQDWVESLATPPTLPWTEARPLTRDCTSRSLLTDNPSDSY
jgi:hypothetical protein